MWRVHNCNAINQIFSLGDSPEAILAFPGVQDMVHRQSESCKRRLFPFQERGERPIDISHSRLSPAT